jgi:hypothetical protein
MDGIDRTIAAKATIAEMNRMPAILSFAPHRGQTIRAGLLSLQNWLKLKEYWHDGHTMSISYTMPKLGTSVYRNESPAGA